MAKRLKKWLRRLLLGAAVLVLVGWLGNKWVIKISTNQPPPLPADTSILQLKPRTNDGKVWLGQSWTGTREGLLVVHLKGTPFEMGYASGILLGSKVQTLENEFLDMIRGYVPEQWKINVLQTYVLYRNRNLSDWVPEPYRQQIHGLTLGCPDVNPWLGNYYNRFLNYHAAHDVSYMMIDNPLVSKAGCTSFGAWGKESVGGHLITGRNFDWEAAEVFSRDRVVIMAEPDGAIPFISLAWAGMAGVVSGMNRAGVSVTLNGAPSSLPGETATPVAMVARDIMQQAHNLDEALKILRDARVFVSTLWLIGSRADGKFIVVEKTPALMAVREPEGQSIVCANHFQTAALKDSDRNTHYSTDATSTARYARLDELMKQSGGAIGPARAAEFLRDRKLAGGVFAGNGHRASLNALIATHATVMDLTDGIFWAASPPDQLGKFVAFDVNDFARELPDRTMAADPMLGGKEFANAEKARRLLGDAKQALRRKDAAEALKLAGEAEALNPGFYHNAWLRGRALLALARKAEAAKAFEAALAAQPAFLDEKRELEGLLREAQK